MSKRGVSHQLIPAKGVVDQDTPLVILFLFCTMYRIPAAC